MHKSHIPVQKQLLHPSFHLEPGTQSDSGDWTARFFRPFGGQARRVQNHPMPLAAHRHRLQSLNNSKRASDLIKNWTALSVNRPAFWRRRACTHDCCFRSARDGLRWWSFRSLNDLRLMCFHHPLARPRLHPTLSFRSMDEVDKLFGHIKRSFHRRYTRTCCNHSWMSHLERNWNRKLCSSLEWHKKIPVVWMNRHGKKFLIIVNTQKKNTWNVC